MSDPLAWLDDGYELATHAYSEGGLGRFHPVWQGWLAEYAVGLLMVALGLRLARDAWKRKAHDQAAEVERLRAAMYPKPKWLSATSQSGDDGCYVCPVCETVVDEDADTPHSLADCVAAIKELRNIDNECSRGGYGSEIDSLRTEVKLLRAEIARRDTCHVCGDCLMEPPDGRCEQHVHADPRGPDDDDGCGCAWCRSKE